MADVKRDAGFYWINHKDVGEWEVARWDGKLWNCTDGFELDCEDIEVDERRITRDD